MKIGEAAEKTGLSVSNIRFYEKKGLLEPKRDQQSKYREYAQEDVERLKLIILYRKMDFSVEKIQLLFQGEVTREEALEQQLLLLKEKQEQLQGAIDLCEMLQAQEPELSMNVDKYLNYVKEKEEKGQKFGAMEELLEDFGAYTKLNLWVADPIFGKFLSTPRAVKIAQLVWLLVFLGAPTAIVISDYLSTGMVSYQKLFFWIAMFLIVWIPFLQFHRRRRETL